MGFYTIAKKLTQQGYITRKGGDWHVDTVRDIANNPIYAGYLTFNDPKDSKTKKPPSDQTLYEGNHQRIIPREEFWELQDILNKRRTFGGKRETSNYYFSSILRCARCGSSMSGHKGPKGVKTYRCSGKKAGKVCTSHIIKEDTLVKTVIASIYEFKNFFIGDTHQNNLSQEQIFDLETKLKSTQKLITKQKVMFENDIISIDELITKTEKLRLEEKQLFEEISQYQQAEKVNLEEIKFLMENFDSLWNGATDLEKKLLVNTVFNQLVIDTSEDYKRSTGIPREIIIVSVK